MFPLIRMRLLIVRFGRPVPWFTFASGRWRSSRRSLSRLSRITRAISQLWLKFPRRRLNVSIKFLCQYFLSRVGRRVFMRRSITFIRGRTRMISIRRLRRRPGTLAFTLTFNSRLALVARWRALVVVWLLLPSVALIFWRWFTRRSSGGLSLLALIPFCFCTLASEWSRRRTIHQFRRVVTLVIRARIPRFPCIPRRKLVGYALRNPLFLPRVVPRRGRCRGQCVRRIVSCRPLVKVRARQLVRLPWCRWR